MKFIIPTTLSLSILFVFSNFTNQKTDETPCLGCQRRENLRKSLPALPTLKNIHYYDSQTQNVKDEYVTIEQIFQKNSAELAILIYDAQTKKYYVYDEQLEALAKTKDDLYFIIIENDRIPHHYGPTKKSDPSFIMDAIKGDVNRQLPLGMWYLYGRNREYFDFEQDHAKAFPWLLKAAQQNHETACSYVSRCYHYGWGVAKNDIEAFKWLEKINKKDSIISPADIMRIAYSYEYGLGVTKDMVKALNIYKDLASGNDATSRYKLGLCYTFGKGVKQDHDEAIKWFHKAIQEDTHDFDGSFGAYIMLGYYFQEGLTGKEPDRKAAIEWYEKAIAEGAPQTRELPPAVANNLAVLYLKDDADEIDSDRIFELLEKAVAKDAAIAQINMGLFLEYGCGLPVNPASAFMWYSKAANQENPTALFHLGRCFFYGIGVNKKYSYALDYFTKAANKNNSEAANFLGIMNECGLGTQVNHQEALAWYQKAEQLGYDASSAIERCRNNHYMTEQEIPSYEKYLEEEGSEFILSDIHNVMYHLEW